MTLCTVFTTTSATVVLTRFSPSEHSLNEAQLCFGFLPWLQRTAGGQDIQLVVMAAGNRQRWSLLQDDTADIYS